MSKNAEMQLPRKKLGFFRPHAPVNHPGGGELITRQEFAEECDVNNIIADFKLTNMIKHINKNQPLYTDLPDIVDYQEALIIKEKAQLAFDALPSKIRQEWDNDPSRLLHALTDPKQFDKLVELGILTKPENPSGETPLMTPAEIDKMHNDMLERTRKAPPKPAQEPTSSMPPLSSPPS